MPLRVNQQRGRNANGLPSPILVPRERSRCSRAVAPRGESGNVRCDEALERIGWLRQCSERSLERIGQR